MFHKVTNAQFRQRIFFPGFVGKRGDGNPQSLNDMRVSVETMVRKEGINRRLIYNTECLFYDLTNAVETSYQIHPFQIKGVTIDRIQIIARGRSFKTFYGKGSLFEFVLNNRLNPELLHKAMQKVSFDFFRVWEKAQSDIYGIDVSRLLKLQREEISTDTREPKEMKEKEEQVRKARELISMLNIDLLVEKGVVLVHKVSDEELARIESDRYAARNCGQLPLLLDPDK